MEPWKQYEQGPWVQFQEPEITHPLAQEIAAGDGFLGDFGAGFKKGVTGMAGGALQRMLEFSIPRQEQRLEDFVNQINSGEIPADEQNLAKFDEMFSTLDKARQQLAGGQQMEGQMREAQGQARERSPIAATAGDIAGNVVGAMTATPAGGVAAAPTLLGRMGMGAVGGAATGFVQPTLEDESVTANTAIGGAFGLLAPPAIEKAIAPALSKVVKLPSSVYSMFSGAEKQKLIDVIEKNADPAQIKAFTEAAETAGEYTNEIDAGAKAAANRGTSDDISRAGKTVINGRLATDAPAKELIKQGMEPGTVALIQSAGKTDKQAMRKALDILKAAKRSKTYAITNRPGDVAGDLLKGRYDAVKRINQRAATEISAAAKGLEGKPADISGAYGEFWDSLQDMGVSIRRGKNGKLEGVYDNSEFARSKGTQNAINDFIARSEKGVVDGLDAHRLKKVIDGSVEYGKKSAKDPILAKGENLLKGLRSNINATLQEMSPAYREANGKFSETKQAMDAFHDAAGPSFNPNSENAGKQLVNTARSIMSNNQKRVPAIDAINALQQAAKKHGVTFDDDILKQAAFMNDLETLFGSSAPTSFGGQIEKSVEKAISGDTRGILVDAAKEGVKKVRGINEENLIKALEELLGT